MSLVLNPRQMAHLEHLASRAGQEECCGVMVGKVAGHRARVQAVIEARNVAEGDRRRRYAVDPKVLLDTHRRARESGCEVIGYYHSHPLAPPVPSATDAAHAWPGVRYLIIGKTTPDAWTTRCWRWSHEAGFLEETVEIVDEADPKLRRS